MSMRWPSSQRMRRVSRTIVLLLAAGAFAQAVQPAPDIERECLAASVRWGQLGCAVSDLDGDHQADYALRVSGTDTARLPGFLSVHLSSSQTAYELPLPAERPALAFVLRDVNGDGYVDLELIGVLNQTIGVYLNDGYGRFEFDQQDRYLTAPSTDLSQLNSPRKCAPSLCALSSSGSQYAAVRGQRHAEYLVSAEDCRTIRESVHHTRFFESPRSRGP